MGEYEEFKVHVGSLSYSTDDDSLRSFFEATGEVEDGEFINNDFEFANRSKLMFGT